MSTNSSVQFPPYSQQHVSIHRPLSALNEDSSHDDGYHDEHQQISLEPARLRCPPVSLGRNRSMEDILGNHNHIHEDQQTQQHRSSSFSDDRQQKLSLLQEKKMKRSSDGVLLDICDISPEATEPYRRIHAIKNDLLYPSNMQQHRSLNDLTNSASYRGKID